MRNKKNMLTKCIIATFIFLGVCFINTQNAKADTTLTANKGITLKTSELKTTKVIKAPSDENVSSSNTDSVSRGTISKGNEVVNYAYKFLGKPYVYGANGPNAFDCSGLTQYVYNKFGVGLSRTTYSQVNEGIKVNRNDLRPGDLVFFNTEGSISHVGIYIGGGEFIHAPRTGKPVMVSSLSDGYYAEKYATARRIFN
ncbi:MULTISPECIES: C40 family peptidase [unclassified Clostridium]|uniref:C40 family peptidase n=1 Tax=unclassified Clostridium TaxID=2614128 RepID=UPI000297F05D|nr:MULTISPECIES: C40 family peptidase [unclassified Clostridium]EKQ55089.1 MAG: cell wall-associated hydrolase, invasion-associated protein [Clostridium sp. Maddingley MBC34-26]